MSSNIARHGWFALSFMAEHIKEKQGAVITKDLIKTHELEQSMLRFTRIFEEKNTFLRDESSTAFSCVMTEGMPALAIPSVAMPTCTI